MESGASITLVATKLTAPLMPPQLIGRPRLEAALDEAAADSDVRVVLVSAPAGSGKSTLVAAWQRPRTDCAWLQVDSADRDAARFWSHVVAALAEVNPQLAEVLRSFVATSAFDPGPLIDVLVNALDQSAPTTLIIDDYHLVASPQIDGALERLIELAPPSLTMVLVTRMDPAIRLSRLRVAGHLAELRAADLRFFEDEAAGLLDQRSPFTTPADHVQVLCERTEGWAAGLVLARLSLAASDDRAAFVETFRGDDRLVVDYLTDEFLAQTSEEDQSRLLATSVLHELTGPLVDAVCATTDGATWLADLAARNQLVIGLGRSSQWYRYHHLLRDVLRMKAATSLPIADLLRRAGEWHRTSGNLDRAAEHFLEAGDLDSAADVIATHSMHLLNLGQLGTVSGYLDRLGSAVDTHLRCGCIAGWIHAVMGRFDDAERSLQQLRSLDSTESDDQLWPGLIAGLAVMVHLGRGNVASAIAEASKSPATTEATQTFTLGQAFCWGGLSVEASTHLQRARTLAERNNDQFALTGVPAIEAVVAMESGDKTRARQLADETIAVIERQRVPPGLHAALANSLIARTSDDRTTAVAAAWQAVHLARETPGLLTAGYALAGAADVLCLQDDPRGPALVSEARVIIDRCPDPGVVGRYLSRVEARHQLAAPAPDTPGLIEDLTDREHAVLRYLPAPMSQREIASELFVSLNTVKTHCKAIYRKLGVGDRKAAVQAARELGLL